jgi:hypothetical protein
MNNYFVMSLYWPNEFKNNFDQTKIKGQVLIKLTLHNIATALIISIKISLLLSIVRFISTSNCC